MNYTFQVFIIAIFLQTILDLVFFHSGCMRAAKKSNYNCDKCDNWMCYHSYCKRKRGEN